MVFTFLLYSSGTYILHRHHIRGLQRIQMYQLRHLKVSWQDKICDVEVRRRAGIRSGEPLLTQNQLVM